MIVSFCSWLCYPWPRNVWIRYRDWESVQFPTWIPLSVLCRIQHRAIILLRLLLSTLTINKSASVNKHSNKNHRMDKILFTLLCSSTLILQRLKHKEKSHWFEQQPAEITAQMELCSSSFSSHPTFQKHLMIFKQYRPESSTNCFRVCPAWQNVVVFQTFCVRKYF